MKYWSVPNMDYNTKKSFKLQCLFKKYQNLGLYSVSCYLSPIPENDINMMYRPIAKVSTPVLHFDKVSPWNEHIIFIVPIVCFIGCSVKIANIMTF
jgi:hypothetical protein